MDKMINNINKNDLLTMTNEDLLKHIQKVQIIEKD